MVVKFVSKFIILVVLLISCQAAVTGTSAQVYGKSVEDLVGTFSIQKGIQIAGSSQCYSGGCIQDPQDISSQADMAMSKDIQPPNIMGLQLEPGVIDSSVSSQVNLTAHIIDDWGGISSRGLTTASFRSPSGSQTAVAVFTPNNLVRGSKEDGFFKASFIMPKGSEAGRWSMESMVLADDQGHKKILSGDDLTRRGLASEFVVS